MDEVRVDMFITSAPSRLPASSKELWGPGRGFEEEVDQGAAAEIVALLGDLAAHRRGLFGEVEQAHDLVARKAFDAKQMAMREGEFGRFGRNAH